MSLKKLFLAVTVLLIPVILSGQIKRSEDKKEILRAGIAMIDITPVNSVTLYGYSARKVPSEGVHDPIYIRAVVFEKGGKKIVLVSSELGSYGNDVFPLIRKTILDKFSLKESELFLSAIHSHSTPVLTLDKEARAANNVQYTEELIKKLVLVIGEAFNNLKDVQVGLGTGSSPVGANRRYTKPDGTVDLGRNTYGTTDKEVQVMKLASSDGASLGAIFDYATHATSLGPKNLLVSGDVLGISAKFVEKILGNEVVSPVFAGASGNIDPWYRILPTFNSEPGWIPEPVLLGTLLGEEVVTVFRNIKELNAGGEVKSSYVTLDCPRRKQQVAAFVGIDESTDPTVPVNITVASVGDDVAFVGFNVEMLTEIGMAIKAASPYKYTFIITHCNGASGYLPPAALYKEGGYEVLSTKFEIGSAEMVVRKTLAMLYDLK